MAVQLGSSVPRVYTPPVANGITPAPVAPLAAPAPAPVATPILPFLGDFSDFLPGLKKLGGLVVELLLTPYRALTGKIGADAFVRPGQGSGEGAAPSQWHLGYEELQFSSTDGTPLKGWYMPAVQPTDKTIILTHGHAGNQSDVLYRWGPWLHKAGYNILSFDFRNSGGSGGTKTTMGFEERRDLSAALTQAQLKGGRNIAVMGLSMGGATALSLAADDPRIKAVVADCSFDTLENAVASRVKRTTFDIGPFKGLHFPFQDHATKAIVRAAERMTGHTEGSPQGSLRSSEPLRAMPRLQDRPIFLIHGAEDDETLPSNSVNLAKANPNAHLWVVPGAKHGESYRTAPAQYREYVLDFLGKSV